MVASSYSSSMIIACYMNRPEEANRPYQQMQCGHERIEREGKLQSKEGSKPSRPALPGRLHS